jgi:co-chaperonin GroES (HSP10)
MKITPRSNILLIKKYENVHLNSDIEIPEDDGNKNLVAGEVVESTSQYVPGQIVIFGKYATNKLTIKSKDFFFIDAEDVVATIDSLE